jgi:hypothetical protein
LFEHHFYPKIGNRFSDTMLGRILARLDLPPEGFVDVPHAQ